MYISGMPAWELVSFIRGADKYATVVVPGIVMIFGVVGLCWGLGLLIKGWMGGQQSGPVPYGRAIALMVVGGAAAFGSWSTLYKDMGQSANKTITNMGSGSAPSEVRQR